jgi:hypothetical protein
VRLVCFATKSTLITLCIKLRISNI